MDPLEANKRHEINENIWLGFIESVYDQLLKGTGNTYSAMGDKFCDFLFSLLQTDPSDKVF